MSEARKWKTLHEARTMLKNVRKELKELDRMMIIAQREICQPKYVQA
jgi:hypothetical protein